MTTITCAELMNKSAAALKAMRGDLADQVKDDPALPARFVQALTDAKTRDEKLGVQGARIAVLEGQVERMTHLSDKAEQERVKLAEALAEEKGKTARLIAEWTKVRDSLAQREAALSAENKVLTARVAASAQHEAVAARIAQDAAALRIELTDQECVLADANKKIEELTAALAAPGAPRPSLWSRLWGKG